MPGGDPDLNSIGRPGDVMARGPRGWGPKRIWDLLRAAITPTTDNAVARWDGTTGKLQNSVVTVSDDGATAGVTSLAMGGALSGVTTIANSGIQTNSNATDATSISDGSSTHAGGVSITKALWVGGLANIAGVATFQNNIAQTGATTLSTGTGTQTINGNVVVTTGKTITAVSGIIFSNETLSQYDEGTFTPTFVGTGTAGTFTYEAQLGRYTRVGDRVSYSLILQISAISVSPTGDLTIMGMPFTPAGGVHASTIGWQSGLTNTATYTQFGFYGESGDSHLYVTEFKSGAAGAFAPATALGSSVKLIISGTYEVS